MAVRKLKQYAVAAKLPIKPEWLVLENELFAFPLVPDRRSRDNKTVRHPRIILPASPVCSLKSVTINDNDWRNSVDTVPLCLKSSVSLTELWHELGRGNVVNRRGSRLRQYRLSNRVLCTNSSCTGRRPRERSSHSGACKKHDLGGERR